MNPANPILIVDDEPLVVRALGAMLSANGYTHAMDCGDGAEVKPLMATREFSLVLLDLDLPHVGGERILETLVQEHPEVPVIVVTGHSELETAVNCMKRGAFDFLTKPVEQARLLSAVRNALQMCELRDESRRLRERLLGGKAAGQEAFGAFITTSGRLRTIFRYLESIAGTSQPILVTGETGVGKELIARGIHAASGRQGEFVAVNVGGLDENAFSDTLFGHEKGAFTGADRARAGLIETAANGTLLLDEIGDLPTPLQVRLLRLLQSGEYLPLGADRPKFMTTRVIASTNQDLRRLRDEGRFRPDLYYRLCTHHVHLPPLRERHEDLPFLLEHFLEKAAAALGKRRPAAPLELLTLLENYPFPGNVRELEAMIFDAVSRHDDRRLSLQTFREAIARHSAAPSSPLRPAAPAATEPPATPPPTGLTFGEQLPQAKDLVDVLIDEALRRTKGNQSMAAHLVGITRQALNNRLRKRRQGGPAAP